MRSTRGTHWVPRLFRLALVESNHHLPRCPDSAPGWACRHRQENPKGASGVSQPKNAPSLGGAETLVAGGRIRTDTPSLRPVCESADRSNAGRRPIGLSTHSVRAKGGPASDTTVVSISADRAPKLDLSIAIKWKNKSKYAPASGRFTVRIRVSCTHMHIENIEVIVLRLHA